MEVSGVYLAKTWSGSLLDDCGHLVSAIYAILLYLVSNREEEVTGKSPSS